MVSLLTVNYRGGPLLSLLLESLRRTIPARCQYEVVVVDNRMVGYRTASAVDRWRRQIRHHLRRAVRGDDLSSYAFVRPEGMPIRHVVTPSRAVFWQKSLGIRGKATSVAHAAGLWYGHQHLSPSADRVLLLDHDVVFLSHGWWDALNEPLADPQVVLAGSFRCTQYERPFLRPFCLMYRREFYRPFGDIYRATPLGDTASRLTYLCEDHGRKLHCYPDTRNCPELFAGTEWLGWGEFAVGDSGRPFCCHGGHERSVSWEDWLARMKGLVAKL